MQVIKIGISPCPNDTFIFENIALRKISIEGFHFEFEFHDIEVLNKKASAGYFDIVKISFAHLLAVQTQYDLLKSGGAMGYGVGPLLVKAKNNVKDWHEPLVAIPGFDTTANFLLTHFYPNLTHKQVILFSEIPTEILNNHCHLGLMIHEGRFTYEAQGLSLMADLGEQWQATEGLPIPLGCVIIKKYISQQLKQQIELLITRSISNYDSNGEPIISNFIRSKAQEMNDEVMKQHIQLYVNDFSRHIGDKGLQAIERLQQIQQNMQIK
jgi:1,4-dihydroxy-6-naphthoate synthase